MKGILFKPQIWKAKQAVLKEYGEAQTRRVATPQPGPGRRIACYTAGGKPIDWVLADNYGDPIDAPCPRPRYRVDEVVYVKEVWRTEAVYDLTPPCDIGRDAIIEYKADPNPLWAKYSILGRWRSPLHLREVHARFFIVVTGLGAEQVQGITEDDAIKEGCAVIAPTTPGGVVIAGIDGYAAIFAGLWDIINPGYPWAGNPWVFRYTFTEYTPATDEGLTYIERRNAEAT